MWIGIITLLPELFDGVAEYGVARRAFASHPTNPASPVSMETRFFNPRDYTDRKQGQVDDKPYGGGPGMVMQGQPLNAAIDAAIDAACAEAESASVAQRPLVIAPTPQGQPITQALVQELATQQTIIFLCGRYEGIDERVMERVDLEVSLGDFVLTGGELVVQVLLDAVSRWLPGTLGNSQSAATDSFADGLLEGPHYTRPERDAQGAVVPPVLLSGDHAKIQRYRRKQSLQRTLQRRPELLLNTPLDDLDRELLREIFAAGNRANDP